MFNNNFKNYEYLLLYARRILITIVVLGHTTSYVECIGKLFMALVVFMVKQVRPITFEGNNSQ